jgi:sporulation protein YlmC with PRC-barrel domain
MIRRLLATTAIATLVATGAMAQTTAPTQPANPTAQQPAAQPVPMVKKAEGELASMIIGENVYNGMGEGAENIGKVNDLVLSPDGQVEAIVIGVGGFLGIGRKDVAIEYDLVEWVERDNDRWLVVETTAEALKAQPEFDRAAFRPMPADADIAEPKPVTKEELKKAEQAVQAEQQAAEAEQQPAEGEEQMAETAQPAADEPATDQQQAAEAQRPAEGEEQAAETNEQPMTGQETTAAIDRSQLEALPADQIRAEELIGTAVYGANDEHVGEIGDVILTTDGQIDAIIVDVGGFLGLGEKEVAIGMDNLNFMTDAEGNHYLYTELTKEQLEAHPAYDEATWAERRDEQRLMIQ